MSETDTIQSKPSAFQIHQPKIPITINRGMLLDIAKALLVEDGEPRNFALIRLAFFLGELFNHREKYDEVRRARSPFSITDISETEATITVNISLLEPISVAFIPSPNKAVAALGYQLEKQYQQLGFQPRDDRDGDDGYETDVYEDEDEDENRD